MTCVCAIAQTDTYSYTYNKKEWKNIVRHSPDSFFTTDEATRIAENVLLYQRCTGGWIKNWPMHKPLTDEEKAQVVKDKNRRDDSTTDNDATIMEMTFLAKYYRNSTSKSTEVREAFVKAVEYLLSGQYDNGGWPQFWPENKGYQVHITYNDDAMVQTMNMLKAIIDRKAPFDSIANDIPADRQADLDARTKKAFDKGIGCILNTQIVVDGKPTVWCQQHDHITLKPAPARAFELASYCSQESAKIVELLMSLPEPDSMVIKAVEGAMAWFEKYKITGIRLEWFTDESGKPDVRVAEDENAPVIWARYYDLEKCEPLFSDRDGLPRKTFSEVGQERRTGYSWYNYAPADLYKRYYKWKKNIGR